jgi:hypothetical protein
MPSRPGNIELINIAGLDYLAFTTGIELSPADVEIIVNLSFCFAPFEIVTIRDEKYLKPVDGTRRSFIDGSVSSILKYTGKTNEIFTRMMINVALYSLDADAAASGEGKSDGADSVAVTKPDTGMATGAGGPGVLKLLDPVAGKGTTLYEGLTRGFDVYGIEIGDRIFAEASVYLKKFLETEKYKHNAEVRKISGANKSFTSTRHTFEIARSREDQKANGVRICEFISGNSANAGTYYKRNFFDMIVGDLPYGVQHGNVTNQKQSSLTRNPSELLAACLPAWIGALRQGGTIVLAWNTNVLPRAGFEKILRENGLSVMDGPAYRGFGHRVDQSIVRDIIAAVKP